MIKIVHTHALSPEDVREPPEQELSEHGAHRGSHLHTQILIRAELLVYGERDVG